LEHRFSSEEKALKPNSSKNYNREAKRLKNENKQSDEAAIQRLSIIKQKSKFQEDNKELNAEQQKGAYNNNIEYIENPNNLNYYETNNVIISSSIFERKEIRLQKDFGEGRFDSCCQGSRSNQNNDSIMKKIDYKTNIDHNTVNKSHQKYENTFQYFLPGASKANDINNCSDENNNINDKNDDKNILNTNNNIYRNNHFRSIGVFYLENSDKTKKIYFDIFHRKIELETGNRIENFFFQDIRLSELPAKSVPRKHKKANAFRKNLA